MKRSRSNYRKRFIALIAAIILSSCTRSPAVDQIASEPTPEPQEELTLLGRVGDDRLVFNGPISIELVNEIKSVTSHFDEFEITSIGGDMTAAIELFKVLEAKDALLIVSEYCFSACAHFLALPASKLHLNDKAVVGFHHTSGTLLVRAVRPMMLEYDRFRVLSDKLTDKQVEFYRSRGLDQRWLFEPDFRTQPVCTFLGVVQDPSKQIVNYRNEFDFFVPTYKLLASMNLNRSVFEHSSEISEQDIEDFKKRHREFSETSFLLSDDAVIKGDENDMQSLRTLPLCR